MLIFVSWSKFWLLFFSVATFFLSSFLLLFLLIFVFFFNPLIYFFKIFKSNLGTKKSVRPIGSAQKLTASSLVCQSCSMKAGFKKREKNQLTNYIQPEKTLYLLPICLSHIHPFTCFYLYSTTDCRPLVKNWLTTNLPPNLRRIIQIIIMFKNIILMHLSSNTMEDIKTQSVFLISQIKTVKSKQVTSFPNTLFPSDISRATTHVSHHHLTLLSSYNTFKESMLSSFSYASML